MKNGSIEIENGSQWRKWIEKSNERDSDLIWNEIIKWNNSKRIIQLKKVKK